MPGARRRLVAPLGVAVLAVGAVGSTAIAQTEVGADLSTGLPWHVSAPDGASWSLVCRFRPIVYYQSVYEQRVWGNRFARDGRGSQAGRLPTDNGSCTVTKTGGRGAVAIAMVKSGESRVQVTRDPARPAAVGFF